MRNQKIETPCHSCGKILLIAPSRLAAGRGKYCSRSCAKDGYNSKAKRAATRKNGIHKFEYQIIAEKMLGRPLTRGEIVHHIDSNPKNNSESNLIVCTQKEHTKIHARQRAILATGNPDAKKCVYCKAWDNPRNMIVHKKGFSVMRHQGCYAGKETRI